MLLSVKIVIIYCFNYYYVLHLLILLLEEHGNVIYGGQWCLKGMTLLNHTANYNVLLIVVCCRDKHPRRPRECWSQCDCDPMLGECCLLLYFVDCWVLLSLSKEDARLSKQMLLLIVAFIAGVFDLWGEEWSGWLLIMILWWSAHCCCIVIWGCYGW